MQVLTACAVRADPVFGFDKRSGPLDTPSMTVYGASRLREETAEPKVPFPMTHGYRQEKRPDRTPCVFATRCVARAVPLGGKPEDGTASDNTVHHPLLAEIAAFLAKPGVAPGA
jgi:hypothetical protein